MSIEQAIEILENGTGYQIIAEDCDADAVYEAIQTIVSVCKRKLMMETVFQIIGIVCISTTIICTVIRIMYKSHSA